MMVAEMERPHAEVAAASKEATICMIVPGLDAGGIENYVLRFLHHKGDVSDIVVMARSQAEGDLFPQYKATDVKIHRQGVSYFNLLKWYKLYRYFKQSKFSVVCDFNENFAGVPMLVARLAGVPVRIAFYRRSSFAFPINWQNLKYAALMNFFVRQNATAILSNSKHAFDFFFGRRYLGDKRFKVIQNGVEASKFNISESKTEARIKARLPLGSFIVGHTGRHDVAKNHVTFFKVARILSQKYHDMVFLFCGKDTDGPVFQQLLQENGIAEKCITLGLRKDVPMVVRSMDVFYFPSVTEGQPNSLIEAMLSGVPVVASNITPIKEALPESFYPELVDPLDIDQAVAAIEQLYLGKKNQDTNVLKQWAIDKFDVNTNFKLFENELK